jgi:hypothetical protein
MWALTADFARDFSKKTPKSRFLLKIYTWGPSQLRTFLYPSLWRLLRGLAPSNPSGRA